MGKFAVGDIVLISFPFSNLKGQKIRPALVVASGEFDNLILCQITSKPYSSTSAIKIVPTDFEKGGLPVISYARPDKLFTAEVTIIKRIAGTLNIQSKKRIIKKVRAIFVV